VGRAEVLKIAMSKTVKKFVGRVMGSSHAGRGGDSPNTGSASSGSDISITSVRTIGAKVKASTPAESLLSLSEDDRLPGAGKAVCQRPTADNVGLPVPNISASDDVPVTASAGDLVSLFANLKSELRQEIESANEKLIQRILAPFDARLRDAEDKLAHLSSSHKTLSSKVSALQAELDKCKSNGGDASKSAISSLEKRLQNVEEKGANLSESPINSPERTHLADLVREEAEKRNRVHNVVLRGVEEAADEYLPAIISSFASDVSVSDVRAASRITPRAKNSETSTSYPRLIRATLTTEGKQALLKHRFSAQYNGKPIYIMHDLTRQEQKRRKAVLPTYQKLRAANVECSLPKDRIIKDRKPMTDDEIATLLPR